jgi:hypothetical protein
VDHPDVKASQADVGSGEDEDDDWVRGQCHVFRVDCVWLVCLLDFLRAISTPVKGFVRLFGVVLVGTLRESLWKLLFLYVQTASSLMSSLSNLF